MPFDKTPMHQLAFICVTFILHFGFDLIYLLRFFSFFLIIHLSFPHLVLPCDSHPLICVNFLLSFSVFFGSHLTYPFTILSLLPSLLSRLFFIMFLHHHFHPPVKCFSLSLTPFTSLLSLLPPLLLYFSFSLSLHYHFHPLVTVYLCITHALYLPLALVWFIISFTVSCFCCYVFSSVFLSPLLFTSQCLSLYHPRPLLPFGPSCVCLFTYCFLFLHLFPYLPSTVSIYQSVFISLA